MGKVLASLAGGLGNQMFQYATARAFALHHGAEVVVDNWSGFVRDTQYRRSYELEVFPIQGRVATTLERLPYWMYRFNRRLVKRSSQLVSSHWFGQFIEETHFAFLPDIWEAKIDRPTWLVGYWQSPLYFQNIAEQIRSELMPPIPTEDRYLLLAEEMRNSESVALGIRIYEESADPSAHSRDGEIKSIKSISDAVSRLRSKYSHARFFVFCTHFAEILKEVDLPDDTFFVTPDAGYNGTVESLWLMTQCKHHIITNSSYYWWGAWLSGAVGGDEPRFVLAADNFINSDTLCTNWEKF